MNWHWFRRRKKTPEASQAAVEAREMAERRLEALRKQRPVAKAAADQFEILVRRALEGGN